MGVAEAIAFARAQIGKPYVFGAAGPDAYDCSGLVIKAAAAGGHPGLPHYTVAMLGFGQTVSQSALLPGDFVFPDSGHVQLYVGNGMVIEAPHTGAFVRETKMWGFWTARRIWSAAEQNYSGSGIITVGSTQTNPVVNPFDPGQVADAILGRLPVIGELQKLAGYLTNATWWKRAGVFMLGFFVILAAIAFMRRGQIAQATKIAGEAAVLA